MPKMPMQRATMRDIATATGISTVSVHKALTGKPGVSEQTRRTVQAMAKKLHYSANDAASALGRSARSIAVVLPVEGGENDYFYRDMWRAVSDCAKEMANFNVTLLPCPCDGTWRGQAEALQSINRVGRAEGVIVANSMDQTALNDAINHLAQAGVPVITVNSDALGAKRLRCISAPNERAGRLAAEFMASGMPHTPCSVALCGAREMSAIHRDNLSGFVQELTALRPSVRIVDLCGVRVDDTGGSGNANADSAAHEASNASCASSTNNTSAGTVTTAKCAAIAVNSTSSTTVASGTIAASSISGTTAASSTTGITAARSTSATTAASSTTAAARNGNAATVANSQNKISAVQSLAAALAAPDLYGAYSPSARGTLQLCEVAQAQGLYGKCLVGSDAFVQLAPYFESGVLRATVWKDPYGQMAQAIHTMYAHLARRPVTLTAVRVGLVLRSNLIDYL